jgi:hypothetical protein
MNHSSDPATIFAEQAYAELSAELRKAWPNRHVGEDRDRVLSAIEWLRKIKDGRAWVEYLGMMDEE